MQASIYAILPQMASQSFQKTRVPGLSCGAVCVILRLAVFVEHRLVTDGQTDEQTDRQTQGHG